MIRWSYLLPRLTAFGLLLVLLCYGIPILVRWSVIHAAHRVTGAAVKIDRVWISPARAKLQAKDVAIARSHASHRNLMEFRTATIKLSRFQLIHRRCVVDMADVRGLRFDGIREVTEPPTHASRLELEDLQGFNRTAGQLSAQLFACLWSHLDRRLEEEFESLQLTRELCQRWPQEFDQLANQVYACRLSGRRLHRQLSDRNRMPTDRRQLESLRHAWDEARELQRRLARLNQGLDQLGDQAARDRQAAVMAFSRDRENLQAKIAEFRFDPDLWADYLLHGELRNWRRRVLPWIQLVRKLTTEPTFNESRGRGENIALDDPSFPDDALIRLARVEGTLPLGNDMLKFAGQVKNLSRSPAHGTEPCEVHLALGDEGRITLQAEFGLTHGKVRRWARVHCQDLQLQERTWGDPETLAVTISPGTTDLVIEIEMLDNQVAGQIRLEQREFSCAIRTGSEFDASTPAASEFLRCVTAAVQHVHSLQLVIRMNGDVEGLVWQIHSDLPERLFPDVQRAVETAICCHAEQLDNQARQAIISQLTALEGNLKQRQVELTDELGAGEQLLSELVKPLATRFEPAQRLLRW